MMYRVCPLCGSSLDPGETCDCQREQVRETRSQTIKTDAEGAHYGKNLSTDFPKAEAARR